MTVLNHPFSRGGLGIAVWGNGELLAAIFASSNKQNLCEDRQPFFTEN
jgi:hypothetical protein